jgi:hypothetical protein
VIQPGQEATLVLHFTTIRLAVEEYINARVFQSGKIKIVGCDLGSEQQFTFKAQAQPATPARKR